MKLTKITLNPKGDSYFILFVDGIFYEDGNDHHEKLSYKIEGIVDFLEYSGIDHSFEVINLETKDEADHFMDYDYQPDVHENLNQYVKRMKKKLKVV